MSGLEGASKYLNNLLLARGLLADGKAIDFAHPSHDEGNSDATMSKVINLVHDLILRRDREGEQRETMATSIRHLRAVETQHTIEVRQLQDKTEQLKNGISVSQTRERAAQSNLKQMEHRVRELKEQNLKMKSMLDQVRAKCIGDVRKRDVEIEKLKTHLTSLQRGKKDIGGMKITAINLRQIDNKQSSSSQDVNSADWSLDKETNEFLAEVVNETSAENVSLRRVVCEALDSLREMTGQTEDDLRLDTAVCDGLGIPGQYRQSRQQNLEKIVPVETLAEQTNDLLHHCRALLKDPSFVPIEEVQIREEEIVKLRAGWEKMADRWKDVVMMMGQWKQRMMLEGRDTDIGGFSDLTFGRSMALRPDGQPVLSHENELSLVFEESVVESVSALPNHGQCHDQAEPDQVELDQAESDLELEPEPRSKRLASSPAKRGVRLPRPTRVLAETETNSRHKKAIKRQQSPKLSLNESDSGIENVSPEGETKKSTVLEKLAAVEAEAAEANQTRQGISNRKRKAPTRSELNKTRRRSTLNPEELAELMGARR